MYLDLFVLCYDYIEILFDCKVFKLENDLIFLILNNVI